MIYFEYTNEKDPCQLTGLTNTLTPALPGDPLYPPRIYFTYDADGNLLQDEVGRILRYDSLGRLISVSAQAGEKATGYHYDSLDTLSGLGTAGGNEQRFYQDGNLANLITGANSSTFLRADGKVLAEHQAGADPKSLLLVSDDKSSVLCELSQDGRNEVTYSAYGHRADDSALSGHLGYNGERREAQTGWYLLGNGYRAFNPLLMRFHSPDSWSPFGDGGMNGYAYVSGNPIGYTDPTGHFKFKLLAVFFMNSGIDDAAQAVGRGAARATRASSSVVQGTSRTAGRVTNGANSAVGADMLEGYTMTNSSGVYKFEATTSVAQQTGLRGGSNVSLSALPSTPGPSRATPAVTHAPQQPRGSGATTNPSPARPLPPPAKQANLKEFKKMSVFEREDYMRRGGIDPTNGIEPSTKKNWMDVRGNRDRYK
ncbi:MULTISPECIES: RHS repeat-associated core domain-containing protein [unclassified Pseudomonas]|uniref:RHS repeat-associated core domain-containing protein n=1 Tax=unclassified Pseudomonas TaxID=196821 RepID=UPI00138ECFE3|nr:MULTISPECIES: RHS repeat-associated core domain-containing protein [unclassified Pseudomonas]